MQLPLVKSRIVHLHIRILIALSDRISRKYTLMVSGIVLALGAAVLASSIYYFW